MSFGGGGPGGGGAPKRKQSQRRRRANNKAKAGDLWRPVPAVPPPAPITPVAKPASLVHSLGDPPLQGQGAVAEHYLAAVVDRAAGLATALAAAGGLLASDEGGSEDQ